MIYTFNKLVDIDILSDDIRKSSITATLSHINTSDLDVEIVFQSVLNDSEVLELEDLVNLHTPQLEKKYLMSVVASAKAFGSSLSNEFAADNIALGITAAGKTKEVAVYVKDLAYLMESGSLYAAMDEIDTMISQPPPVELSPFITVEVLTSYKSKIQAYLS